MLVSLKHRAIILRVRNPNQLKAVIPTATDFVYQGHELIAVPHRLDEVQVLRNMGIDAPSPIESYYDWKGVDKPFDVQRITAGAATIHKRLYVLNQMGTGKTNAAAWAGDYLMRQGKVRAGLITCPLSCMNRVWEEALFAINPEARVQVLYGDAKRRIKRLDEEADWYIINHDGLKIPSVLEALQERYDIELVIVDELAEFSNTRTDRWKALNRVINGDRKRKEPRREWAWGLTGTPTPTAPTDAFAQCKLLTPDTVPKAFGNFRDQVMRPYGPYKWVARDNANETVFSCMQPAVRFARDDCLDLPPRMTTTRHCEMSVEQSKAYNEMYKKLKAEIMGGQITAQNAAIKALKLAQIAVGVVYDNKHGEVILPSAQRLDTLRQVIQESEGKVIVYVPFTGALNHLAECVEKYASTAIIDGHVSPSKRTDIFRAFQNDPNPRVLIAQPGAMSHGLTLTEANTIVWYGPTNSNRIYTQANDRITRAGQVMRQFIVHLEGCALERAMYADLQKQTQSQEALLEMFASD